MDTERQETQTLDIDPNDLKETVEIPLDAEDVEEADHVVQLRQISMYDETEVRMVFQQYRQLQIMELVDALEAEIAAQGKEVLEDYGVTEEAWEQLRLERENLKERYPKPSASAEKLARRMTKELIEQASVDGLKERNHKLVAKYKEEGVFRAVWEGWCAEQFSELIEMMHEEPEEDEGK